MLLAAAQLQTVAIQALPAVAQHQTVATQALPAAVHQAAARLAAVTAAEAPEAAEVDLAVADIVAVLAEAVDRHQAVAEAEVVGN